MVLKHSIKYYIIRQNVTQVQRPESKNENESKNHRDCTAGEVIEDQFRV